MSFGIETESKALLKSMYTTAVVSLLFRDKLDDI